MKKSIFALIIITSIAVAKDQTVNQAIEILDNVRNNLNALSADFEQYEINPAEITSETSTGKVWLEAPNKFKWHYLKPIPQLIIASGAKVWIYDEDLEQVTVKQQNNNQNPIYVLLNKELTEKNYHIELSKELTTNDQISWIKLTPKAVSDEIKVVWLAIKENNLSVLKLKDQLDNMVVFEFNNIDRNPKLAKNFFEFDIPKGTDMISNEENTGDF